MLTRRVWLALMVALALGAPLPADVVTRAVTPEQPVQLVQLQTDSAQVLQPGEEASLTFRDAHQRGVYRIQAPGQGTLTLQWTSLPQGLSPAWRWLNAAGQEVRGSEADYGIEVGESVWLEVRSAYNDWHERSVAEPVRFTVTFTPVLVPGPRNTTLPTARSLAIGETAAVQFMPRLARFVYRLEASAQGTLTLQWTSLPQGLSPAWRWLDVTGKERAGNQLNFDIEADETVFIEVRSAYNDWHEHSVTEPTTFAVEFISASQIVPLGPGRRLTGKLLAGRPQRFSVVAGPGGVFHADVEPSQELTIGWLKPDLSPRSDGPEIQLAADEQAILAIQSKAQEGHTVDFTIRLRAVSGPAADRAALYPREPPPVTAVGRPDDW